MKETETENCRIAGAKKHRYKHESVLVFMADQDGNFELREAVSMRELESALTAVGRSSEYEAYRIFEEMLWEQHERQLADVDRDTSFSDSYDEPADYQREYAKHLLTREFKQSIVEHRESLVSGAHSKC